MNAIYFVVNDAEKHIIFLCNKKWKVCLKWNDLHVTKTCQKDKVCVNIYLIKSITLSFFCLLNDRILNYRLVWLCNCCRYMELIGNKLVSSPKKSLSSLICNGEWWCCQNSLRFLLKDGLFLSWGWWDLKPTGYNYRTKTNWRLWNVLMVLVLSRLSMGLDTKR